MGVLALALIVDWFIGDPDWLWRRVKHPVVGFGAVITFFDEWSSGFEKERRRLAGFLLLTVLLSIAMLVWLTVLVLSSISPFLGGVLEMLIVVVLLAQNSLKRHVEAVRLALVHRGFKAGREAVSMIVGRDVSTLDESGISKAAIESLAENYSDGVMAPAFWYAVFGLPGIVFYKAVNTADSMIGHRTQRHEVIGKPAAVLDDWMNWIPARLSAGLIVVTVLITDSASKARRIWSVVIRDAATHRSPNAGWPETAFASALGLALGGPRYYGDQAVEGAYLNATGRRDANARDIATASSLFRRVCFVGIALVALIWFFLDGGIRVLI